MAYKIQFLFHRPDDAVKYLGIYQRHISPILENFSDEDDIIFDATPRDGYMTIALGTKPKCADIFMSHGLADKNWRNADDVQRFKLVFISGPAWEDKLVKQGFDGIRTRIVGYPLLDPYFDLIAEENPPIVLWAPTHTSSPSTYPHLRERLMGACKDIGARFIESPHPFHSGKISTHEFMAKASVVVADSGSSIYEAWALGKPVVLPDFEIKLSGKICDIRKHWSHSFEAMIYDNKIGYHVYGENKLSRVLSLAIDRGITEQAESFIEKIFPKNLRGLSGVLAATAIKEFSG